MVKIVNWSKYQSYKDRRPPWIRFHRAILDDFQFQSMTVESRALLPMLWLLACENKDPTSGEIDASIKEVAFRLRIIVETVTTTLAELEVCGFIECIESVTKPLRIRTKTVISGKSLSGHSPLLEGAVRPQKKPGVVDCLSGFEKQFPEVLGLTECIESVTKPLRIRTKTVTPETETETETEKRLSSFEVKNEAHKKPSEGEYFSKKKKRLTGKVLSGFLDFWDAFGYRVGKADAADAWLLSGITSETLQEVLRGASQECSSRKSKIDSGATPKMAQGWLSSKRWEDMPDIGPGGAATACEYKVRKQCHKECKVPCRAFVPFSGGMV